MPLKNGRYEESEAAVLELLTLKDRQIDILSSNFSFFQMWWECKWMDWRDFFTRLWQASFGKLVTTLKKTLGHFQSHGLGQLHIYSASEGSWRIRRSPPLGGAFHFSCGAIIWSIFPFPFQIYFRFKILWPHARVQKPLGAWTLALDIFSTMTTRFQLQADVYSSRARSDPYEDTEKTPCKLMDMMDIIVVFKGLLVMARIFSGLQFDVASLGNLHRGQGKTFFFQAEESGFRGGPGDVLKIRKNHHDQLAGVIPTSTWKNNALLRLQRMHWST